MTRLVAPLLIDRTNQRAPNPVLLVAIPLRTHPLLTGHLQFYMFINVHPLSNFGGDLVSLELTPKL